MNVLQECLVNGYDKWVKIIANTASNTGDAREAINAAYIKLETHSNPESIEDIGAYVFVVIRGCLYNKYRSDSKLSSMRHSLGKESINVCYINYIDTNFISNWRDSLLAKGSVLGARLIDDLLEDNTLIEISRKREMNANTVKAHYRYLLADARKMLHINEQ